MGQTGAPHGVPLSGNGMSPATGGLRDLGCCYLFQPRPGGNLRGSLPKLPTDSRPGTPVVNTRLHFTPDPHSWDHQDGTASSPRRPLGWPSREQTDIAFKDIKEERNHRGGPLLLPDQKLNHHMKTTQKRRKEHLDMYSTMRAADCQAHSSHISTLMRKPLPVGCIRYSLRMGFKTLSFFLPVLGGPPGEAGSAPLRRADRYGVSCRRRTDPSVSLVGSPLESGVSPGQATPVTSRSGSSPRSLRQL